jgi:hypothetical protein
MLNPPLVVTDPPEAFKVPAENVLTANQVSVLRFLHKICSLLENAPDAIPVMVTPEPACKVTAPLLILAMLITVPMGYATLLLGGIVTVAVLVLFMVTTFPASSSTQV